MENVHITERVEIEDRTGKRRRRVSWGAIFAGTAVVLAVSMLLSILGSAIGMFIIDPTSSEPFSGVFGTVSIWTGISILIGLACGGFVAGKLSGADGFIHGFVVWSMTMIAGVFFVGSLTAGLVRLTGNILGATGKVVAEAGSAVGNGVSALANEAENIFGDIDFDFDGDDLRSDVRQALRRSGVPEFQPDYLRGQYRAVSRDLRKTVKRVVTHPMHAGELLNGFNTRLNDRVGQFGSNINHNDVVSLVANNSNLTRAQAEEMVNEYMQLIAQGREQMVILQQNVAEASREWEARQQEWLQKADKATNRAGWTGILTFIILLGGAAVTAFAGAMGAKKTMEGYEA